MKKKNLGLPVSETNEKKNDVKKKICSEGNWMGYCPFESQYNGLYRDTGLVRVAWAQPGSVRCAPVHQTQY